ncbi:MAG: hypothetical protein LQ343_007469 [Gyalolechia ehrenbergii]|nr:MAG: hypothetical protein LQ343_007469 [Gyalolechia ehrenbergii]
MLNSTPPSLETILPPLTLIVASTPSLGIGLRGTFPWPPLKSDLQFFARVTKRPPPASSSSAISKSPQQPTGEQSRSLRNAVIMGRKTYYSIPPKFRPLKDRYNVVITRSPEQFSDLNQGAGDSGFITASSISSGLQQLQAQHGKTLGRVFVIGGAEIYKQVLELRECERILWTRLRREWECDTFFPEGMVTNGVKEGGKGENGWRRRTKRELEEWTGDEGLGGPRKEGEVEFEISMWEREAEKG